MVANCDNARHPQHEAPERGPRRRNRSGPGRRILNTNSRRCAPDISEPVQAGGMPVQHVLALEAVAGRLARKYPPDWLERHWGASYAAALAATFVLAVVLALACAPWWGMLVPLVGPSMLLVVLPRLLFGRTPGRPRWAHHLAALDSRDALLVRALLGAEGIEGAESDAPLSGARFFDLWRAARGAVQYRRS